MFKRSLLFIVAFLLQILFRLGESKEYLVSAEFQKPVIVSSDVVGWSRNIIRTCEQQNIVEYTGQVFGVFSQDITNNNKTYSTLPPHWSALVRLDLMLYGSVDASEGDNASINLENFASDRYTKNDQDGYKICSNSKGFWGTPYNDAVYPYQKNITHNKNTLLVNINSYFTGTNSASDYEGYAFKHLSVYVDTCFDTCQSCSGPSSDQCSACITGASVDNGSCKCQGGKVAFNFQCVSSCPNGYVANPNTSICEPSKCLNNCSSCVNQVCTQCISPNKLLQGECVAQCPSYSTDKTTYCEDKITGLVYGGYIFKGLYSTNFGDSDIQGQGLKLVNFKNGGATFSSCGGDRIVGGWNVAGSGSEIRRELPNFKPHWSIRIGFKYVMIDSWANTEAIQVVLDNTKIVANITRSSATSAGNVCGDSNLEAKGIFDYNVTHISTSLTISIRNTLSTDKSPFAASFGIREMFVLVNYCQDVCSECNAAGCTKCPQGTYLYQLNCLTKCPTELGYWGNGTTNTCDVCTGNCVTCDVSATSCLSCKPGTYLYNKVCSTTCPDGYAPNTTTLTCDICHTNCKTCTKPNDNNTCTACQGSRFLSGTQCLTICPDGTYGEFSGNKCMACDSNCLTCKGKTNKDCQSCNIGKLYQPDDNSCGSSCKSTQYINGNNCTACDSTCLTCSGGTSNDCKSCNSANSRYLSGTQCVTKCPDSLYPDTSSATCKACNNTCFNCTGPSNNQCTQCTGSLYLNSGNVCLSTCPNNQFQNNTNNKCESCDANCATCVTAKNNCISCASPQYLDLDGVCKAACPSGKWPNNTTKKCELCDSNCLSCDVSSKTNCTQCSSPKYLNKSTQTCDDSCPTKFFGNNTSQTCDACDSSCSECSGSNSNQCLKCSGSLYLDTNQCKSVCSSGKFANSANNICDVCDKSCAECQNSSTNCIKCSSNTFLNNNTCTVSCPDGKFGNTSTRECNGCDAACGTCYGPASNQCTNCLGGKFFDPVSLLCVDSCQSGYYANSDIHQCMKCESTCKECSGPLNQDCTQCPPNVILFNKQCITSCPDSYYKVSGAFQCNQCYQDCFNCTDNLSNSCSSCKDNLYLTPQNACSTSCPDGYYPDIPTNTCKKCDSSCTTCSGPSSTQCTTCSNSLFLENNECKATCSNGWMNSANHQCDPCNTQCTKCNGPDSNSCTECPNGKFLNPLDNSCGDICPDKYYQNSSSNKCSSCDNTCKNCTDIGADKCTECEGTLFFKDGKYCSSTCNSNEFGNLQNNKCENCDSKCKTCSEKADSCTGCGTGTFLVNKTCSTECPDSTYENSSSNECSSCNSECATCLGSSKFECTSCQTGTYLNSLQNNCVSNCPTKFYPDSSSKKCQDCPSDCDQCANNAICQKCSSGFYLYHGTCLSTCPDKYFKDSSNQNCTQCYSTCQSCTDATKNGCQTCIDNTFKNSDDNSCLYQNECPSGKFADSSTNKCQSCHSNCANCTGSLENQCTSCPDGKLFYKGECLNSCPSSAYQFQNECKSCDPSCATCNGSSSNSCQTCPSGQYLQVGSCKNQCVLNFYPAVSNGQQICLQCNDRCSKCNGPDSNNCTECPSQYFKLNTECLDSCPEKYTYDTNKVCQLCNKKIKNNQCVDSCGSNEFTDSTTLKCTACASECSSCTGPLSNECQSCATGYFLNDSNNQCSSTCPDTFFGNKSSKQCESCDNSCNSCSGSGDSSCSSCKSPLILFEGKCLKDAPEGYYKEKDKDVFNQCDKTCKTCEGGKPSDCISCHLTNFFLEKSCHEKCPSNYFNDEATKQCKKCEGQCKECKSDKYCLSCINNMYAFNGTCVNTCDITTQFQDEIQKECVLCDSSCQNKGCTGPKPSDCNDSTISISDSLIVKILVFKTILWIFTSIIGTLLDYKNAKIFGKAGQVRQGLSKLSIRVSDQQINDLMVKENQGTKLNENAEPSRRKRRTNFIRNTTIRPQVESVLDGQEFESPNKRGMSNINFSSTNIQSQVQMFPHQSIQDLNPSPTSRTPTRSGVLNTNNFNEGQNKGSPLKKLELNRISEAIPTFNNMEDQPTSNKTFNPNSGTLSDLDQDSPIKKNHNNSPIEYPRKFYFTIIGNEIISVFSVYDPDRSRLFRAAMIYIKYMVLFFVTYISQQTFYGIAATGLLAGILVKGILQSSFSSMGICLRKNGILALIAILGLIGTDMYLWFIPKLMNLSYNTDIHWSFLYILTFSTDLLIIQSVISFINYIVTVRSKLVDNNKIGNKLLNLFFRQPALLQKMK